MRLPFVFGLADLPPPLTEAEDAEQLERAREAIARDLENPPPPPKQPSQIISYDPASVRVTFNGVELQGARAFIRVRTRRQIRAARRARKLRRGWA
jgi:hypothetical protein